MGRRGGRSKRQRKADRPPELAKEAAELPIAEAKESIVRLIRGNKAVVLVGETGCGKTTQVPQFLIDQGLVGRTGVVAVTQPRRVAAIAAARRVSAERGWGEEGVGGEVGYAVRFDDRSGPATRIRFMTGGVLLREALDDPLLRRYAVVVLDEAHERSLHADVLLGLARAALRQRQDLRVVVMSATLDAGAFAEFFGGAPAGYLRGRRHPVTTLYATEAQTDAIEAAVMSVLQIHEEQEPPGDVLVFLAGADDIDGTASLLRRSVKDAESRNSKIAKMLIRPFYAALPPEKQALVFVILATNVAETSLTIPGVRYVVDSGLHKAREFDPRTGLEALRVRPISQAMARQRAGRAGRDSPGQCFRLFTEAAFLSLEPMEEPEVRRVALGEVVLMLRVMGIRDVLAFDFLDAPPREAVLQALETLLALGALDSRGEVTQLGSLLARYPLEPSHALVMALAGGPFDVGKPMAGVIAMLSAEGALVACAPSERDTADSGLLTMASHLGDHLTLLTLLEEFLRREGSISEQRAWARDRHLNIRTLRRASDISVQLITLTERLGSAPAAALESWRARLPADTTREEPLGQGRDDRVLRCLTAGFFLQAARWDKERKCYVTFLGAHTVHIHPSSVLFRARRTAPCVLFNQVVDTTRRYLRYASVIREEWLPLLAPHFYGVAEGHRRGHGLTP